MKANKKYRVNIEGVVLKSKRIELTLNCIETLSIHSLKNKTVFKLWVENHLEELAKKLDLKK